ncbi:hypothetical protein IJJ53_01905 [Candidatus Saccharibacteria bacterium]|nr:hypothetical protein [Candidatus Saccharibacteria bacterium]
MKIKNGQKVFLQKYEVTYIMHELNSVPAGIVEEIFKDGKPFIMSGPIDGQVFACVFENPKATEWLMEQDWIVDYDQYKNVPVADLKVLCEQLKNEYSSGVGNFNAKDDAYREKHFDEQNEKFSNMRHKISSLYLMIDHLEKKTNFVFPDEISNHSIFQKNNKKKSGFFARLFGRGTQ